MSTIRKFSTLRTGVSCLLITAFFAVVAFGQTTTAPSTQPAAADRQAIILQGRAHWNAALADFAQNHLDLALIEAKTALADFQKADGDAPSADVARTLLGIGNCLAQMNRPADALPNYQASMRMYVDLYKNEDRQDVAIAIGKTGWCMHLLGQDDAGAPLLVQAGQIVARIVDKQPSLAMQTDLDLAASSLAAMNHSADALPLQEAALNTAKRLCNGADNVSYAVELDTYGDCLSNLGRYGQALPYFQNATQMGLRLMMGTDSFPMATGLEHLGDCLSNLGRYNEALPVLQSSLDMRKRLAGGKDNPDVAVGMNMVAICLSNSGRAKDALAIHQAALEMEKRLTGGKDHWGVAYCMEYVALDMLALGQHDQALPLLRGALEMRKRIFGDRDEPAVAESMGIYALDLAILNRDKEALPLVEQTAAMAERLRSPFMFISDEMLGALRLRSDNPAGAADAFGKAIDSIEEFRNSLGGDDQDRMGVMNAYGGWGPFSGMVRAQLQLGHADSAAEYLDRGRAKSLFDYLERGERMAGGDVLEPMFQKAKNTGNQQMMDQIQAVRQQVLAAEDQVNQLTSQINRARALNNDTGWAQIAVLQPKLNAAMQKYADAHRAMFNMAGPTTFTSATTSVQIQSMLQRGQHMLMYSIAPKDAVVLLIPPAGEAITGMYLTEADGKTRLSGKAVQQLISQYRQAVVDEGVDSVRGAVRKDTNPTTHPAVDTAALGYQLFCELMPAKIWQQIQSDNLDYVVPDACMAGLPLEMLIPQKPSGPRAEDNVYWLDTGPLLCYGPSATALLDLRRQEPDRTGRTYAHEAVLLGDPILQRNEVTAQPPPKTGAYVENVVEGSPAAHIGLRKGAVILGYGGVKIDAESQFDDAVDKLELLSFHGKLTGTPKLTFWLDGQIMEQELPINSPPGVKLDDMTPELALTLTPPPSQPMPSVAMRGDADLSRYGALAPLPGTRQEVAGIYQVLTGQTYAPHTTEDPVVVLLGNDASNEKLAKFARRARYLHLATHGLVQSDALYSSIVLTQPQIPTPQDTGVLTLHEMIDHWWGRLDGTELVVLSACDSEGLDAKGASPFAGEGVFGLPWGFMYAGSPAVVASLWEVQDASTAELMQKFYSDMRGTTTGKLAAFTAARKELKKDFPKPFFWAPFIYLGDPN